MIESSLILTLLLNFFLTGCLCSLLIRSSKWAEITRPFTQASLIFGLGTWFLYRHELVDLEIDLFAIKLVPWLIMMQLGMSLLMRKQSDGTYSLHPGVILFSTFSLCGLCLSDHLGFLFLFGEALAVSLWLIAAKDQRRKTIFRTLVTSVLIGLGTNLTLSEIQVDLTAPTSLSNASDQSEIARFAEQDPELGPRCRVGLLCFMLGISWRVGFFPFPRDRAGEDSIVWFQRDVSLLSASVLVPLIFLPRLEGGEQLGQMLIFTFAVPTMIRETLQCGWRDSLFERIQCWFVASAILMWMGISQELFNLDRGEQWGLWLPMGREMVRLELLSSLAGFLLAVGILRELSHSRVPCPTREDLSGLLWTHPLPAALLSLALLSWVGLPGLAGFQPRFGVLAGAFEIAGLELDVSTGYALVGVIMTVCQMILFFLVLLTVQSLSESPAWHRHTRGKLTWRLCVFALLLLGLFLSL
ncbi:MAG: hypothetical protein HUJ26_04700 [Planctomycetaceae bacterium]|nr:hypothetical protein [Planctomycetaceae bacterium]